MSIKHNSIPASPGPLPAHVQPPEGPDLPRHSIIRSLTAKLREDSGPKGEDESDETKTASASEVVLGANLSVDDAMSYILSYKNFNRGFLGQDFDNEDDENDENDDDDSISFQNFHSIEQFGISARKSKELWRLEIERLVAGINNIDTNILFPELGYTQGNYSLLSSLCTEIVMLLRIMTVDHEGLLRKKHLSMHQQALFDSDREYLRRKIAPAEGKKPTDATNGIKGNQHSLSKEERRRFIFALIDFITLVLARILVYSAANNRIWSYTCLISVATFATKLKVMSKDPAHFARISLDAADDIALYNPSASEASNSSPEDGGPPAPRPPRATAAQEIPTRLQQQRSNDTFSTQRRFIYLGLHSAVNITIIRCTDYALYGLAGRSNLQSAARNTFEICSVVYETGLERFRTWIYQERDGGLQATACQKTIPMVRPAFELLQKTARSLETRQKQESRPPPTAVESDNHPRGQQLKTHVHWNDITSDEYHPGHRIEIRSLAEAITIMVPLLLVSPAILTRLPDLFQAVTALSTRYSENQEPPQPAEAGKFKAFFSMSTDGQVEVNDRISRKGASLLSNGLMTRDKLLRGPKATEILGRSFSNTDWRNSQRDQADSAMEIRTRANREMNKWIYEENAVLVSCRVYVWMTMSFAVFLAVVGVVVGFTVRGRIEAVDPFNITTYCWVLAAFAILVSKSVRVETWPWRDFLHGHVRCRSISELHSVTGISEQFILCKLLDAEETTILNTRGPYNVAFIRRSDGGFSIDRPLTMWTMLLSGLIMVKVSTEQGPAIVCLDVRRGTRYIAVGHLDDRAVKSNQWLVCMDLTRPDSLLPLKRQGGALWRGVVGLYNNRDAKFI